jgi:hypothetical protein
VLVALVGFIFALGDAQYLWRGYCLQMSIQASFENRGPFVSHISFPPWLAVVHGAIYLALFVILGLSALFRRQAFLLAWMTFLAVLIVGALEVQEYGTIGSPTSIKTVLLILVLALLTTWWKRTGLLRRG